MSERAPQQPETPGADNSPSEYGQPLQKGEVFSVKPTEPGHEDIYRAHTKLQSEKHQRAKEAQRQEWEAEEARRFAHERAYEEILNPANVLTLKSKIDYISDVRQQKMEQIHEQVKQTLQEIKGIKPPHVKDWQRGWRRAAEAPLKGRARLFQKQLMELKHETNDEREDAIFEHLYANDHDDTLLINDELRAELERMLALSYEELEGLKRKPDEQEQVEEETPEPEEAEKPESEPDSSETEPTDDKPDKPDLETEDKPDDEAKPEPKPDDSKPEAEEIEEPEKEPDETEAETEETKDDPDVAAKKKENEEKREKEIRAQIKVKDKIWSRRDRANQLKEIAIKNNSIEAAEKIVDRRQWLRNPFRIPGNDKTARNEALIKIAQNNLDDNLGLEAALKITNRLMRNRTLEQLGKAKLGPKTRDEAMRIAGEIKGPEQRKLRPEILKEIALSYDDVKDAVQFVKRRVDGRNAQDVAFLALVKKYKEPDLIDEIKGKRVRQKALKLL